MICKFNDGYFIGWESSTKLDPKDFNSYDEYIDALDQQPYNEANNLIIEFPEDMSIIRQNCFSSCQIPFKGIKISKNIQVIEEGAFWYLSVDEISVEEGNPYFDSRENCNCVIDSSTNTVLFGNIYSLIPNSVKDIDRYAFCCGAFNKDDVKKYARFDNAYYFGTQSNPYLLLVRAADDKIENCLINKDTEIIYTEAFERCNSLKEITIPSNVKIIAEDAFFCCKQLEKVIIDDGVKEIKSNSFAQCHLLEKIIFNGDIKKWKEIIENDFYAKNSNIKLIKCKDWDITI